MPPTKTTAGKQRVGLRTFNWSLSNLVALIRQQLFVYRDLYRWIDNPFEAPPALQGLHDGQLALF